MSNYKNLYKLIDGLNSKIKILDFDVKNIPNKNKIEKKIENKIENKIEKINNQDRSKIESYKILSPSEITYGKKKYIGLLFDNNFNNYETDDNSKNGNAISFINLAKSNIIINYSIYLELNYTPLSSIICVIALGIRTKTDSKIKIIKGSKQIFDVVNSNVIMGNINLTNTTIYMCGGNEELCMIADFGSVCKINSRKSLIKLFYFFNF